ncbi:MAG: hypothetical protein MI747_23040, partial [Desulfobacterales bacterium]|nr:hypothetical protein [Desulfobacterales bacterium]
AIWYLGSGAAGLCVLTFFLARRVRETGVRTLPEMVETFISPRARTLAALIIIIAWTAILAAQFSATARIISAMAKMEFNTALWLGAALIIAYTALGGQRSVIKSDQWQFGFMLVVLVVVLACLVQGNPGAVRDIRLELFNSQFTPATWTYYMLIIGGSYVVCPMLFSRLLSAEDGRAARNGALAAVPLLLGSALVIVLIGLLARGLLPGNTVPDTVLTQGIMALLPPWLGTALLLALLSAVISSADSCLITAATVMGNDLFKKESAALCRLLTLILGAAALGLSLGDKSILGLLFAANDVYVSGIVAPVFVAMVGYGRFDLRVGLVLAAMVFGGGLGLTAALTGVKAYSFAGIGVSLVLSLVALKSRQPAWDGEMKSSLD